MRALSMACSLARRAARLAIGELRLLGKTKTPPQAEAFTIGRGEGAADTAHDGKSIGERDSVGARGPRTDEHLLQLPIPRVPAMGRYGHKIYGWQRKIHV